MKKIYLDNAATTFVDREVMKEMSKYFSEKYGNPSSFHAMGLEARNAVENARKKVSKILNCLPGEIIFTSGGTESINFALKGIAFANRSKGNHIITSKIEHHAILHTCKYLEKQGFKVTYLNVDRFGRVNPNDIEKAITEKTILISIMYANNEIGTVEPISEIGNIAKKHNIYFHTDACQAAGALDIDVKKLNVDLMTINGSKIYGPKGIGILYLKTGIKIEPLIHGGGQEFNLRSGTENVPSIVGFAKALEIAQKTKNKENKRLIKLRNYFIKELLKVPKTILNGPPEERLPNNINVSFLDIEGESILLHLNELGIYASTGSACTSKSLEPSHVITAIGLPYEVSHGSIRFSLGKKTKLNDIKHVLKVLPKIIKDLRAISPVKLKMRQFR